MDRSRGTLVSLGVHGAAVALLFFRPGLPPSPLTEPPDEVPTLFLDPAPPPPPPLPRGNANASRTRARPPAPEPRPKRDSRRPETPIDPIPAEKPALTEALPPDTTPFGTEQGSPSGVVDGTEQGGEGGRIEGGPGGRPDGVVGGMGRDPVGDYDRPPRLLKVTKPLYPPEAFTKKIEGTVVVEILIDETGHVASARIVRSVPLLDDAARQVVYEWRFSPALKHGRPVPALAQAPVTFRIF